ncbi:metallophosphoesterase [Selenomonas sp. AE3005]|uniref:metallophosphoesterase family protein n=1 Tax=Selenomonas sp. AE3005 TaxID=1485543 RepID=UPI00047FE60A|nr:metallophosphoesterase [Selenomonas sp. AE3005]
MKRREFLRAAAAFIGCLSLGYVPTVAAGGRKDYYHIVLISDLHLPVRTKSFPAAADQKNVWEKKQKLLQTINAWTDVDEVALLGDLAARYGKEAEFKVVDEYVSALRYPYYAVAGNHDYAYKDEPVNKKKQKLAQGTLSEKKAKLAAFQKRYHLPAAYYARDVGNCRLLYLSPDGCGSNVELSAEQLAWLQQEIATHKNGPVLFFCHGPLKGTLRTYNKKINTVSATAKPDTKLAEIMAAVPPGSLWISGHTHTPPTNDSYADISVNRVNRNLVNIHNPTIDAKKLYTNSLYIYKDKIVIRTYDHNNGIWLQELERTFPFVDV